MLFPEGLTIARVRWRGKAAASDLRAGRNDNR
jgi:hypothetical protein